MPWECETNMGATEAHGIDSDERRTCWTLSAVSTVGHVGCLKKKFKLLLMHEHMVVLVVVKKFDYTFIAHFQLG